MTIEEFDERVNWCRSVADLGDRLRELVMIRASVADSNKSRGLIFPVVSVSVGATRQKLPHMPSDRILALLDDQIAEVEKRIGEL